MQDRYLDSSVAYQGAGRVLDADEVRDLSLWATEGLLPDLTVLLDLDADVGRARLDEARTRYDRLEAERRDFHARVREAYLELARRRARALPRARRRPLPVDDARRARIREPGRQRCSAVGSSDAWLACGTS